jgi:hypothetical protein
MKLDDAEQAKYEALAEAIWLCIKPIVDEVPEHSEDFERAMDRATLALMKLVDDAYKQGRHDNNQEWLETEWEHLQQ